METFKRSLRNASTARISLIALLLAILVSSIIMLLCGYNPLEAFGAMFMGAFASKRSIAQTLIQATPIIFTGLAFTFSKKATLTNLGLEGQLHMGGIAAAFIGALNMGLPMIVHLPLALLAGIVAGGLYAGLVGFLKVRFGSNEVIATIMLNTIAINVCGYLVNYPLMAEGSVAQTEQVLPTAQLPRLMSRYQLTIAILIAVATCVLVKLFLDKTTLGYEIQCVGLGRPAAETAGISIGKVMIIAMVVSGAIAGMAGATHVLGVDRRYINGFSPGYGFDGIAVAALGADSPVGVIFAGVIFGALRAGCMELNRTTSIPTDFVNVIQALVVIFVAAPLLIREFARIPGPWKKKGEVKADAAVR